MSEPLRLLIVGGVAGGASAAARARRISEDANIILLERGEAISFANCGLPYYIGGVIKERERLLVQTAEGLRRRYRIDVRVRTEAVRIDPAKRQIVVRDLVRGSETVEAYDRLILSPGAEPVRPAIPGIDSARVLSLRTLTDMDAIAAAAASDRTGRAVVIGGGYIGLEMVEALRHRGLQVTLVEMAPQVMNLFDAEMAAPVHQHLLLKGVDLRLGQSVVSFEDSGADLAVKLNTGDVLRCGLAVLAIGVRPSVQLAREAGLALGPRGGIRVDEQMRTSDPNIYAVGDAVETPDLVNGEPGLVALAGPASRQGRIAADNALGRQSVYRGSQGTGVCKIFDLTIGMTGASEKTLQRKQLAYEKVYVHPASHAGYYPGAYTLSLKLLFDPASGRVLGAQAVGADGVDKRIDVLAVAVRAGLTVYDLEHLELAYAPPYGSAKDPVNYAGFVAANVLRGDVRLVHVKDLLHCQAGQKILDVRTKDEVAAGTLPGAVHIPIDELRDRLSELSPDKEWLVACHAGLRGYVACRILSQRGYRCRNLSGGFLTYQAVTGRGYEAQRDLQEIRDDAGEEKQHPPVSPERAEVDARGLQCPGPIQQTALAMKGLSAGQRVRVLATDPGFATDIPAWCRSTGNRLETLVSESGYFAATLIKGGGEAAVLGGTAEKRTTLVVFSQDFDRAMSAFIIANGAAAMGHEATLFFTFWGLNILRRKAGAKVRKRWLERLFGWMMPRGYERLQLSRLNMGGMGTKLMQYIMRKKKVASLEEMIRSARENGVHLVACSMTMDIMGIKREELIDGVEEGGVASFLNQAERSRVSLFI